MRVTLVPNTPHHDDFEEFKHAVEVRSSHGTLIQRWTYRSEAHAEMEFRRIQDLFRPPVERGGRVIVTSLVVMLVPWAILAMACGR